MTEIRALLLAAGLGTRLGLLTKHCPKCLIPIFGKPLLEYWLSALHQTGITSILVNIHHHQELVERFLSRPCFSGWVRGIVEEKLLGTAGTLRENAKLFSNCTTFLAHADNWCHGDLAEFFDFHQNRRPENTLITMMTFRTESPESCGIVNIDNRGIVREFYEKVPEPSGNLANGAVYLLEPDVITWLNQREEFTDFSTQVLPEFVGQIATWENKTIHRDIGTLKSLIEAHSDPRIETTWSYDRQWQKTYEANLVHEQLLAAMKQV